ncbi:MAG: hypothetical protein GY699_02290 [Desulfobacteraceae bacterium]|nr:hypothetical protein [Desulfobacteraceae bacterium]
MNDVKLLKGWKMLIYTLFLGPIFLVFHFQEMRNTYPVSKYFAWASLLVMAISAYLMFTFTFSPNIIRIAYLFIFLSIFGMAFFYCWSLNAKSKSRTPSPKQKLSLSRAFSWMLIMAILFAGLNNIVRAIYYWLLGEQVTVYFSSQAKTFQFWIFVGLLYGFIYGIRINYNYFNRDLKAVGKSIFSVFILILIVNGLVLATVIYPLQRLTPISYSPQVSDFLFYFLLFIAITFSTTYLLRSTFSIGAVKSCLAVLVGIPLIVLHVIIVSAYAVTLNLTIASILEDRQNISMAKEIYAKAIPYIKHDNLIASLHHRQGVLQVLNQDYPSAVASFKKVLADYSEDYPVFLKARRYMDAFEKNRSAKNHSRKILTVRHQTFEQAASCFPNSLSVILNYYEEEPVSTRKLSYAIKEGFSEGTFIWKAQAFLNKNGFELITTFWQNESSLISLLEADYPVLVYIPGHVYTLYGYDSRVGMFFTYDTAKSNRWNDKPFWELQRHWMEGSFLMSVVVPKKDLKQFVVQFPQFERYRDQYQLFQKAQISDYYESKGNFWKDYDRYGLSNKFGLDRLKMNESYYLHNDFSPFPWNNEAWENEVLPVLSQSWALDWKIIENYILYLLDSEQPNKALGLIEIYQSHLSAMPNSPSPRFWDYQSYLSFEEGPQLSELLELKLAALIDENRKDTILSVSDKLIGITDEARYGSYWGHYFKARHLMDIGDLNGAADVLLSSLDKLRLGYGSNRSFRYILEALDQIHRMDQTIIKPEKLSLIEVARINHAYLH